MKKTFRPRVLLIGLGRFGMQHLQTWQELERAGVAELAGAVVSTEEKRRALQPQFDIPLFAGLNPELLKQVDAADIVTPSATHFALARQCLSFVHVLVEKPLGVNERELQLLQQDSAASGRVLMVNHLYRFHPVVEALEKLVRAARTRPRMVFGSFLNPAEPGAEHLSVNLEFLHYFDLMDYLFGEKPESVFSEGYRSVNEISLRYPGGINAVFELGWKGSQKVRNLEIQYPDRKLIANFRENLITVLHRDSREKIVVSSDRRPLETALRRFVQLVNNKRVPYPDARVGARVAEIALRGVPGPRKARPRAVVIGGGIFGASCALELAAHCEVVLAERHPDLLTEASFNNQFRHHSGFHYPRSLETVQEILSTRSDFDAVFPEAVVADIPSYYCTALAAKEITGERYLAFCTQNRLVFHKEAPPPGILDRSRVSLSLRTDEVVLDIPRLREIVRARLDRQPRIETLLETEAADGEITSDGTKLLSLVNRGKVRREGFDYLINASYANTNILARWFGFPVRRLRLDFCEMLLMEMEIPKVSVTVLDGPFASMVNTGQNHLFLISQVQHSLLKSVVTKDGLPPSDWGPVQSNRANLLRAASEFFPVLRKARFVESRYGIRAVTAFNEDYDGRPTVVTRHGFGCWSVLGGKIATCVSNAREIVRQIFPEPAGAHETSKLRLSSRSKHPEECIHPGPMADARISI